MIPELIKETEEKMKKAVEAARHEFTLVRTGRADPGLLEHVRVQMYGQELPLNQVAAVSVPEPRQLLITPFDRNALAHIEKGILKSDVNITPNNDGNSIRLTIPQLNEQRRKDLIKLVHQKAEHGRSLRAHRTAGRCQETAGAEEGEREPDFGERRETGSGTGAETGR